MSKIEKKKIVKNPKLVITCTQEELGDLINGETFKWTVTTDQGQDIDVLLQTGEEGEEENDGGEIDVIDDSLLEKDNF